ncbi:bifunctional DNA primase/helicase, partial [Nostoc punctiforme FACHB-252]|nr:bifunctional DNA primase/helicase [Nostoc punctiforme FACHB-252]
MSNNQWPQELGVGDQMLSSNICEYPNNLTAAEYHELAVSSAIHPELIERNFSHIEGETVYDYLFISQAIPRKNAGRVTDGFLKAYLHLIAGGLWISGLDPQLNWRPMEWGRMKPSLPRIDWEKGKSVKYESPPKTPNRVTYFDVPDCIWDLVALRYSIKRYHSPLALRLQNRLTPLIFWEW